MRRRVVICFIVATAGIAVAGTADAGSGIKSMNAVLLRPAAAR
jgi:hypothetical protein